MLPCFGRTASWCGPRPVKSDSDFGLPLTIAEHPRARRVLIKLVPGKGLRVVVPRGFDRSLIPGILEEKREWIERTRRNMEERGVDLSGALPEFPERIEFRAVGREYEVGRVERSGTVHVRESANRILVSAPGPDDVAALDALKRFTARKAREQFVPWLSEVGRELGLEHSAVRIRFQKTRWGSCSARGTISLNARLLFLPPHLVDQLFVHELCHLRHLDHSQAFWKTVAGFRPGFRENEAALNAAGRLVPLWAA